MMAKHEHVISSDGTRIAVWRSGAGPALLLVHGTTADHTRWQQVAALFERQFTVYAMDRRGRGGSGDADTYSIAQEGEDLRAVAEAIDGPLSILGHSYGAVCCMEGAPILQDLHRLILYEPPLPIGATIVPHEVRRRLERLDEQNDHEAVLLTFFREIVGVPEQQLEVMRSSPAWAGRLAAAHTVAREVAIEDTYRPDLERLRVVTAPTLLLLGGDSPAPFRQAILRLNALLQNSRIHEMPGQQHIAMDIIPEEFMRIASTFILA